MADKQVRIRLAVDGTGEAVVSLERVSKGVKDVGDKSKTVSGEVKSFGSQIAGSFNLTAMAAGAVVAGLMGAVKSAIEADKAAYRLSIAVGKSSAALMEFAEARQRVTVYEDDATIAAMSRIAMVTKDEAAIKALTIASQNLASRTGKDLLTATEAVAKAAGGSGMALRKMGITMDTSGMSSMELAKNLDILTGHAAELEAQTAGGQATQALIEWGNAWEDIGAVLLPLAPLLKGISFIIGEAAALLKGFGEGLAGVALIVTGEFSAAMGVFDDVWETTVGPIKELLGINDDAAASISAVGGSAKNAAVMVNEYADAAKAAGVNVEDLETAVNGYLEQAEKQKATDAAILLIQKEHPDIAKRLGLETEAQKKNNRELEEAKKKRQRANEEREREIKLAREQSIAAQRQFDDYAASKWSLEEQAQYWQGIANATQNATDKAEAQIKAWEFGGRAKEKEISDLERLRDNYESLANEGLMTITTAQGLYNNEILAGVEAKEVEQALADGFVAENEDLAKSLGILSSAQIAAAKAENERKSAMDAGLAGLAAAGKKWKSFAMVAKRVAQGQALVETYYSARKTYSSAMAGFPPPMNLAIAPVLTAAVIAGGLADVANIGRAQFASGGYVRGHGGGRSDMVDARLSAGEGVLTAATVARIGGEAAIDRLNAGGGTGGGLTINFTGPVTDRAFVRDYIVPEVRKAVGRSMA